jgi:hypothetical protein
MEDVGEDNDPVFAESLDANLADPVGKIVLKPFHVCRASGRLGLQPFNRRLPSSIP